MTDARAPLRPPLTPATRRVIDAALVVGLLVADIVGQALVTAGRDVSAPRLSVGAVAMAAACAGVLWWWRRRPMAVLAATLGLIVVAAGATPPGLITQQSGVTLALGAFAVGCWSDRRAASAAAAAVFVVLLVLGGIDDGAAVVEAGAGALAVIGLPWALGSAARSRRLYVEEVVRRLAEAERDRDERARRAVLEERTHIARELHDVVAHHVSLIGVQAGAARTALERSPNATGAALAAIEAASRSAVGEMRHLLDVLRDDDAPTETRPQPGVGDIGRLVDSFRAAGLRVGVERRGDALPLAPSLDLCCYRIVEEALTNVTRHSAAPSASVAVDVDTAAVRVQVTDPGPSRPSGNGSGRGLTGMRERVALFGGWLSAGPTASGGFAVVADLPRPVP